MTKGKENTQAQVGVKSVFVQSTQFKGTTPLHLLKDKWQPQAKFECKTAHRALDEQNHEVALTVKVVTTVEKTNVFELEVQQIGIFHIENLEGERLEHVLEVFCATTLLPYARETISSLVKSGGYPPFYLGPIDFEPLYQKKREATSSEQLN